MPLVRVPAFKLLFLLICGAAVCQPPPAQAASPNPLSGSWMMPGASPTGRWVTPQHDAVIEIIPCGANLCGQIVGMALAPGAPVPQDWQGDSQCNLTILEVAPDDNGDGTTSWSGSILDPRDGSVYHASIRLDAAHNLNLHAYIGLPIFGETQSWTPYHGTKLRSCRLPGMLPQD